jgi:hypothetical protein
MINFGRNLVLKWSSKVAAKMVENPDLISKMDDAYLEKYNHRPLPGYHEESLRNKIVIRGEKFLYLLDRFEITIEEEE